MKKALYEVHFTDWEDESITTTDSFGLAKNIFEALEDQFEFEPHKTELIDNLNGVTVEGNTLTKEEWIDLFDEEDLLPNEEEESPISRSIAKLYEELETLNIID